MSGEKEYMGDSVYAEICDGQMVLTVENGYGPTETIYLEREVYNAIVSFAKRNCEVF